MTNSPPENDAPLTLRVATQLSAPPAGRLDSGLGGEDLTVATLAMSGMFVLASGWLVRRRRLLAQPLQEQGESAVHPEAAVPQEQAAVVQPEPVAAPIAEPEAAPSWAPDSDIGVNSSWAAATAPMPRRPSRLGVATQKRLIKSLMWVRTAAGGAAILAAIAVVVFWTIETTDRRAGETGLNMPLLLGALAAWALSWGAGQLANTLNRLFFNRVHPKFDT